MIDTSKMKGHTPGPWRYDKERYSVYAAKGTKHCIFEYDYNIDQEADVYLIAAAPDLLLEVEKLQKENDYLTEELSRYKAIVTSVRQAINDPI